MKTPEESLGVNSDTYNKIVDECVYGEQNPAWSEEDEGICIEAIKLLTNQSLYETCINLRTEIVDWLKSLKDRYTWKPSEKQIEALDFAADCIVPAEFSFKRNELKGLLEQLKKLREE